MHAPKNHPGDSSLDVAGRKRKTAGSKRKGAGKENLGAVAAKIAHDFNNILATFSLPLEAMRMNPAGLAPADLRAILEGGTVYAEELSKRISALARALKGSNDAEG